MPTKKTPAGIPASTVAPGASNQTLAAGKIVAELSAYREETGKLSGRAAYQKAPEIVFTEAAADRLQFLAKDPEMAELIMAGGTLEGCVKSIVDYCRRDIGRSGEISEDEFRAAIRDYYRMPDRALKSKKREPVVEVKSIEISAIDKSNGHDHGAKLTAIVRKPKREPTMLTTQLDMFGLLQPAEKPESEEEDTDE